MNKSDRLGKLFLAVGAKDWKLAVSVAEEICTHEENVGHTTVARLLRSSLRSKPNGKLNGTPNSMVVSTALKRLRSKERLDDVYLRNSCKVSIENFVAEWKIRDQILAKQLPLRSKVLLHGPPGCGKSLTAVAIGNELNLPVYMVRFDAVIGSYLGQTAINLRQVFQFAEMTPCVIVFDELDALGKRRGNPLDVGELDRIVISLMQELEHSHPAGIIVATSNLPKHLDHALWRRFDLVQEFPKPSKAEMKKFAALVAKRHDTKLTTSTAGLIEKCKSFAEVEQQVQDAARRILLKRIR
jgi:SpoVK/Ycf46/Vps4 family AAA+-type ATPase